MSTLSIIFLLFTFVQTTISIINICEHQPNILSKNIGNLEHRNLYFYIPMVPYDILPNSIIIYDEYGMILDCLNEQTFIKQNQLDADYIIFTAIKHVVRDLYAVFYLQFKGNELVHGDENRIIFMDDYFNVKNELTTIYINNLETQIFKDSTINMHDIIVDEKLNYAIIIIKEKHLITDAQELFPNAQINDFIFVYDSFCAINLKTGKQISAISGNGVFVDMDQWWEYIGNNIEEYRSSFKDFVTATEMAEFEEFDSSYVNALNLVDGSHFSPKYRNKKLILANCRLQDTIYLLKWDFEETNTKDDFAIIWKLPSISALEIIKKEWFHRWEYVNDPFYGPSRCHDLNVHNLPKRHILMLDNGSKHRAANEPGLACPMSRSVEYKIEMDANGPGYHRITMVFSYPKVEDYPKWIYLEENEGPEFKEEEEECVDFWNEFRYQMYLGSSRKTDEGDYVMTSYVCIQPPFVIPEEALSMVKIDNEGNVINRWYNLNSLSASYRINPIKSDYFRNGIYSQLSKMNNRFENAV